MTELQNHFIGLLMSIATRYEGGLSLNAVGASVNHHRFSPGGIPSDWTVRNILDWTGQPAFVAWLDANNDYLYATFYYLLADALVAGDIDWPAGIPSLKTPGEPKSIPMSRYGFIELVRATNKWRRIADAATGEGSIPCPLCDLYRHRNASECTACPVYKDTGLSLCRDTPYQTQWVPALEALAEKSSLSQFRVADNPSLFDQRVKDAALAEWEYLQDLCNRTKFVFDTPEAV